MLEKTGTTAFANGKMLAARDGGIGLITFNQPEKLNAMSVEVRSFTKEKLAAAIAGAQHNNGWISFYTHEVCDSPSEYGATPAMLDDVLKALAQARIDVLPMREAVAVALG